MARFSPLTQQSIDDFQLLPPNAYPAAELLQFSLSTQQHQLVKPARVPVCKAGSHLPGANAPPESGLLLQFGEAVETPDGGLDAETGVLPDVSCNPKQAMETCLSLIRESK